MEENIVLKTVDIEDEANISLQNGDEIENELKNFNPLYRQIFAAVVILTVKTCTGISVGFSAILLPQLNHADSSFQVTQEETSLIASMMIIPMAIGSFLGGFLMQKFGRKKTPILMLIFASSGWIFIYLAQSAQIIIIGRGIYGFFFGAAGPSTFTLIAEVTSPKFRGILLAGFSASICLGILIIHVLGTLFHWRTTCLISIGLIVVSIIMILPLSETYVWYSNKNKMEEAKKAFFWYRGYSAEAKDEFRKFIYSRKDIPNLNWSELLVECKKRTFLKPLLITIIFFLLMQFCGNNAVIFYSVSIMQQTVHNIDSYTAMLILDTLRVVIAALGCYLRKYPMRPLTMISGFGTAASLYFLAIAIYFAKLNPENNVLGIISFIMLLSYIIFETVGLLQLPWALAGEIFPPLSKGIGVGLCTAVNFLAFFTVVQTGLYLFSGLGSYGAFTFYASCALCGTIIMYFILPETHGKTLREIEEGFKKRTRKSNNIDIHN